MTDRNTIDKIKKAGRHLAQELSRIPSDGFPRVASTGATSPVIKYVPGDTRKLIDEAVAARRVA